MRNLPLGPLGAALLYDTIEAATTILHRAAPCDDSACDTPEYRTFVLLTILQDRLLEVYSSEEMTLAFANTELVNSDKALEALLKAPQSREVRAGKAGPGGSL